MWVDVVRCDTWAADNELPSTYGGRLTFLQEHVDYLDAWQENLCSPFAAATLAV